MRMPYCAGIPVLEWSNEIIWVRAKTNELSYRWN